MLWKIKCNHTKNRFVVSLWVVIVLGSCNKNETSSEIGIVSGQPTTDFPAVFGLGKEKKPFCSATAIGKNVAITAGHCVCDQDITKVVSYDLLKVNRATKMFVHRDYSCSKPDPDDYDIAVVKFESDFEYVATINLQQIQRGKVTMVGYGPSSFDWFNLETGDEYFSGYDDIKRAGVSTFDYSSDSFPDNGNWIRIIAMRRVDTRNGKIKQGETDEVSVGPGDSGSPLIQHGIIGILSNTSIRNAGIEVLHRIPIEIANNYVYLRSTSARSFLREAVKKGYQIPASCCECTRSFYGDNAVNYIDRSFELEVGDSNSARLCGYLNNTKHFVEQKIYTTSHCRVAPKVQCERLFNVKLTW